MQVIQRGSPDYMKGLTGTEKTALIADVRALHEQTTIDGAATALDLFEAKMTAGSPGQRQFYAGFGPRYCQEGCTTWILAFNPGCPCTVCSFHLSFFFVLCFDLCS